MRSNGVTHGVRNPKRRRGRGQCRGRSFAGLRSPLLSHLRRPVRRHDATDVPAFLRPRHLIIGPRSGNSSDATNGAAGEIAAKKHLYLAIDDRKNAYNRTSLRRRRCRRPMVLAELRAEHADVMESRARKARRTCTPGDAPSFFLSAMNPFRSGGVDVEGTFFYSKDSDVCWTRRGDWLLPFRGHGHYDGELGSWVGLHTTPTPTGYAPTGASAPATSCPPPPERAASRRQR
ncbi:hypothetical protein OsI_25446 [Oryza sativa Indica Group]|uniref:Uncharacterized protein n=1 Tax=Oryza sativa subsp. indica TaxID=39946 RepID=A2YJP2_ORYSI|nr:hypothetical protein OsI_25446 [Oryza sativa Indica Group]